MLRLQKQRVLFNIALPCVISCFASVILHAATPTPGTLIADQTVPVVVEGKTAGSLTLKAGTQVSVITVLPNDGGVVVSQGDAPPFIVPKTALTKESILLSVSSASSKTSPTPSPALNPSPSPSPSPSPRVIENLSSTASSSPPLDVPNEHDFATTSSSGVITITGYNGFGGNLVIPSTINGLPVGVIGRFAFANTQIVSVVIPDTVTRIEEMCFNRCNNLTEIKLPKGLLEFGGFGENLFKLKIVALDPGNKNFIIDSDGVLYDTKKTELLFYPPARIDPHYTIPNTVKEVGAFSFAGCKNLQMIDLPESLLKIGRDAFNGSMVHEVKIPNAVSSIGAFAFRGCQSLTSVYLGKGVKDMGVGVFVNCKHLRRVQLEGNAPLIEGNNTFQSAGNNFKVYYHPNAEGFTSPVWVDSGGGRWNSSVNPN